MKGRIQELEAELTGKTRLLQERTAEISELRVLSFPLVILS